MSSEELWRLTRLDRPLTDEELKAFGGQEKPTSSIRPFIRLNDWKFHGKVPLPHNVLVGIKGSF